ncbi:hypothetical protein SELR_pSRC300110 (plasmid) [Selenomonas ruminantium subsp. lactilytica TAM6421]|uniref:Uncharacterized protein n=1 Tax=Selenomonas ruminantium subsp. lactilytica (strain NBRC 103574 / TAM6421) TaxID=927704 RepID=I0GWE7_SELRL|nr:hypothetical protein [Selenomonas ruminantium]BAL85084.1 hypothetical protein SELR_pSRC300110 [Selenomonas ruminantium subsp. lactilytica TAM6421]
MAKVSKIFFGVLRWIKSHAKYIGVAALAMALFAGGWFACKHFGANVVTKTEVQTVEVEKPVPVQIPVEVKGDTVIKYVEKDSPADADVQIESPAPAIAVSYNGEKTELNGLTTEKQKFDQGKLQVEQKSEAVLDVTPIVNREVQAAVKENTEALNKTHAENMKKEKHKRHKREFQSFLAGAGVGLAAALL